MTGITALLLFTAWTLLLMMMYIGQRVASMLMEGKPADSWTRGREVEVPAFCTRAQHAHLNALENLPVFAAVVLGAYAIGERGVADSLGGWILLARLAQSTVHLIGVNHVLVQVRAAFFTIQVVLIFSMILALVF